MISCEHFIYSLATGLIATAKIDKLLTQYELEYLCHIGDHEKTERCFLTKINKFVRAVTYVKPVRDEYHRKDVWSHTILICYQDYFEDREREPVKLVASHFISPSASQPVDLEPIKI